MTTMKINFWECSTAFVVVLFGGTMAYFGSQYPIGTVARMGTGYFPVILGLLTMGVGLVTLLSVRTSNAPAPDVPWRVFFFVFLGVLAWALLVERVGLLPSSMVLIVLSSLGRAPLHLRTVALTAVIVSVAVVFIFINGFGLPLRPVVWW
jgi:hypothetical protein